MARQSPRSGLWRSGAMWSEGWSVDPRPCERCGKHLRVRSSRPVHQIAQLWIQGFGDDLCTLRSGMHAVGLIERRIPRDAFEQERDQRNAPLVLAKQIHIDLAK